MKQVLLNLVWLLASFGIFVLLTLILAEDVQTPLWLPFDPHKDVWLAPFLKFFGILILMPPFVALLASLINIGRSGSRGMLFSKSNTGPWTLQLSSGFRVVMLALCFGLCIGILFALWAQEEPLGIWIFASPLLFLAMYGGLVALLTRLDFDQDRVTSLNWTLRRHSFNWRELEEISYNETWYELRLHFAHFGTARVSLYLNDLPGFIAFAQAKLKEADDARIARG